MAQIMLCHVMSLYCIVLCYVSIHYIVQGLGQAKHVFCLNSIQAKEMKRGQAKILYQTSSRSSSIKSQLMPNLNCTCNWIHLTVLLCCSVPTKEIMIFSSYTSSLIFFILEAIAYLEIVLLQVAQKAFLWNHFARLT